MSNLRRVSLSYAALTLLCLSFSTTSHALDINLRGYTANGTLPPAAPSAPGKEVDIRAQLQAAIDAVGAAGGGTVLVPGDTDFWFVSKPVFLDKARVTLRGDSMTTICPIGSGNGDNEAYPPVLVGIPRQAPGKEITASHRDALAFDAARPTQTLDATAGARFGLRTKGRSSTGAPVYAHGYVSNSVLAMGPIENRYIGGYTLWGCPNDQAGKPNPAGYNITFDLAIKQNTAGVLQGTICGDGMANDISNRFTYWMLGTFPKDRDPHTVKFKFKTGTPGSPVVHELSLGAITDTNLHRLTIQLAIGTGQCAAWLDGKQTSTLALGSVMNADGTVNHAKELWKYEQGAFQLGALHNGNLGDVISDGLDPVQQHVDWTYGGFQMGVSQRYKWEPTLKRADGQPITDGWEFFSPAYGPMAANLPLKDNPVGPAMQSDAVLLGVDEGEGRGHALGFWLPERAPVKDTDGLLGLRSVSLQSLSLGGPLLVGEVRSLTLQGISPRGQNIFTYDDQNSGVINGNDLPVITNTDCGRYVYSPAVSVIYWANKELHSTNFNTYTTYWTTVRLVGCHGVIHYGFLNPGAGIYYYQSFAGARGGPLDILDPIWDNEGYPVPTRAAIYYEFGPLGHGVTRATNRITLKNVFTGTIPYTSPVLDLPDVGEGTVYVENIAAGPTGAPFMKRIVMDRNPNAYGILRNFLVSAQSWQNTTYYGFTYAPGTIVYNRQDGNYYRCTATHHPGESYLTNPKDGGLLAEDNKPHADDAWKEFWERQPEPADWKTGTAYAVGDVVRAQVPNGQIYITLPVIFRCIQAHTAGDANFPIKGADWKKYWVSLQWTEKTDYNAGADYVSADGAYYHCIKTHTATDANRPRPWDKLPADPKTWPFRLVEYDGPPGTHSNLVTAHYESGTHVPPVSGYTNANAETVFAHDPQPGQPTQFEAIKSGVPGVWRGQKPIAPGK